jgi:uncharacterized membrane protein YbjE (DUF340 family)
MSTKIIMAVVLGICAGYFILPEDILNYTNYIIDIGLCLLLFFVGMDIGKNKDIIAKIRELGLKIIIVPIMIIIGSILGSIVGGTILSLKVNEAGAVGAGLGWYTLSAMILADYSPKLSALAFITNVIREVIALTIIPIVSKYIGDIESIAPAGATAMDTSLPVISNATNPQTAVVSFITGVILSMSVPLLVPLIISI